LVIALVLFAAASVAAADPHIHRLPSGRHLFQRGDQYIDSDVVFGVKEPLIVDF
jgi:hypothetical protein